MMLANVLHRLHVGCADRFRRMARGRRSARRRPRVQRAQEPAEQFYARVGPRHVTSDDGSPISEWALPLSQMLAFVVE